MSYTYSKIKKDTCCNAPNMSYYLQFGENLKFNILLIIKDNNHKLIPIAIIISKFSMPFCLISEIIQPVINIQRRQAELNIILPRVNNFDIKQKKGMEYSFYYMPPTPNKIWEDKG